MGRRHMLGEDSVDHRHCVDLLGAVGFAAVHALMMESVLRGCDSEAILAVCLHVSPSAFVNNSLKLQDASVAQAAGNNHAALQLMCELVSLEAGSRPTST